MRRLVVFICATSVAGLLPSCGGDGTTGPPSPSPSTNQAPQFSGISNQTLDVGEIRRVTISATDPDGDQLTFTVSTNPGFVSISNVSQSGNTTTATCEIAPTTVGSFSATIRVTDGRGGSDTEPFTILVEAAAIVPESGEWSASPSFGDLSFEVNAAGTAIMEVGFQFSSFRCGSITWSGGVTVSRSSGWPIQDNGFVIETDPDPDLSMQIAGTFDATDEASGTWEAVSAGTTCSGSWDATPGSSGSQPSDVTFGYLDPDDATAFCVRGNVVPPESVSGAISASDCLDEDDTDPGNGYFETWRVKVAETSTVLFEVFSDFDSFLFLIEIEDLTDVENSLVLLDLDDDSGPGFDARLSYRLVRGREYAIVVAGYDPSERGQYRLDMGL